MNFSDFEAVDLFEFNQTVDSFAILDNKLENEGFERGESLHISVHVSGIVFLFIGIAVQLIIISYEMSMDSMKRSITNQVNHMLKRFNQTLSPISFANALFAQTYNM